MVELMKYTPEEIEFFKLRARILKLEKDLEKIAIQGNLFPDASEQEKLFFQHQLQRLKNRLQRILEFI
jgi:hypothetical protein